MTKTKQNRKANKKATQKNRAEKLDIPVSPMIRGFEVMKEKKLIEDMNVSREGTTTITNINLKNNLSNRMTAEELYKLNDIPNCSGLCVRIPNYKPVLDEMKQNHIHLKKICGNCSKIPQGENCSNLLLCGGCKGVYYCSKKCQKEDWKDHKQICKSISRINDSKENQKEGKQWKKLMEAIWVHIENNQTAIGTRGTIWQIQTPHEISCSNIKKQYPEKDIESSLFCRLINFDTLCRENLILSKEEMEYHKNKFEQGYTLLTWRGFCGMVYIADRNRNNLCREVMETDEELEELNKMNYCETDEEIADAIQRCIINNNEELNSKLYMCGKKH
jgi:hypothetical protein